MDPQEIIALIDSMDAANTKIEALEAELDEVKQENERLRADTRGYARDKAVFEKRTAELTAEMVARKQLEKRLKTAEDRNRTLAADVKVAKENEAYWHAKYMEDASRTGRGLMTTMPGTVLRSGKSVLRSLGLGRSMFGGSPELSGAAVDEEEVVFSRAVAFSRVQALSGSPALSGAAGGSPAFSSAAGESPAISEAGDDAAGGSPAPSSAAGGSPALSGSPAISEAGDDSGAAVDDGPEVAGSAGAAVAGSAGAAAELSSTEEDEPESPVDGEAGPELPGTGEVELDFSGPRLEFISAADAVNEQEEAIFGSSDPVVARAEFEEVFDKFEQQLELREAVDSVKAIAPASTGTDESPAAPEPEPEFAGSMVDFLHGMGDRLSKYVVDHAAELPTCFYEIIENGGRHGKNDLRKVLRLLKVVDNQVDNFELDIDKVVWNKDAMDSSPLRDALEAEKQTKPRLQKGFTFTQGFLGCVHKFYGGSATVEQLKDACEKYIMLTTYDALEVCAPAAPGSPVPATVVVMNRERLPRAAKTGKSRGEC